ncbi:MAG: hypothetical protein V7632_2806 [Bradyrhizobium sp.]|jgi:hypothetical protein
MSSGLGQYPLDHLPVVDYRTHKAYGQALARPGLGTRVAALKRFAFGMMLIAGRRLADYEHLPRPKDKRRKLQWMLRHSPTYLRLILSQRLRRLAAGSAYAPKTASAKAILNTIEQDGIFAVQLSAAQLAAMADRLKPYFGELEQRLAGKSPEQRKFDETRLWIDPDKDPEIYAWFNETMRATGIVEAASAYLKRQVVVSHIVPQINDPSDNFWANHFVDVGVEDSICDYFHVDATYNLLKMIIYVNEVGEQNGPFSYVKGSHRAGRGFWDGMIRRANDYAELSWTKPGYRKLFFALPRALQRKGAFGADIPNDSRYVRPLLDNALRVTSANGDGVLFDPGGIHRGGMVQAGRRLAVGMMLTEQPD